MMYTLLLYNRGDLMEEIIVKSNNYKKILNKEQDVVNNEIEALLAGRLVRRGKLYGHVANGKEVGITKNEDLIIQLCRKKYLQIYEKQIKSSVDVLSHCIKKLENAPAIATPKEIIRSMPPAYQGLPESHFYHPSAKAWLLEPYRTNPHPLGEIYHTTPNGIDVRSKSEFGIATELERYNVPYRYECELILGGQTRYPDFIAINPFTGKEVVWEHFGIIDDHGYVGKMNKKMTLYINHGYIPFENFIYTFEFNVMDIRLLQSLIENIILKP